MFSILQVVWYDAGCQVLPVVLELLTEGSRINSGGKKLKYTTEGSNAHSKKQGLKKYRPFRRSRNKYHSRRYQWPPFFTCDGETIRSFKRDAHWGAGDGVVIKLVLTRTSTAVNPRFVGPEIRIKGGWRSRESNRRNTLRRDNEAKHERKRKNCRALERDKERERGTVFCVDKEIYAHRKDIQFPKYLSHEYDCLYFPQGE